MNKRLIRENPAMFLGKARPDLERVYAIDDKGTRYNIIEKDNPQANECCECLIPYPNDLEFEITNHKSEGK